MAGVSLYPGLISESSIVRYPSSVRHFCRYASCERVSGMKTLADIRKNASSKPYHKT